MILAVSRFRVANGREDSVATAFLERPRLVDQAPGFLGLEVFTPPDDPAQFYLVTRWTDEPSFRAWHGSEDHHRSHKFIPKGLRLDPAFTKVIVLDRLRHPGESKRIEELAADGAPFLAGFLEESRAVHVIAALRDGTIVAVNGAAAAALGVPADELTGRPLWPHLTEPDAAALRGRVAGAERRPRERFLLNLVDASHVPHSIECRVDVQPDGFVVIGEPRPRDEKLLEERLLQLNNELAVLAREHARQAKELEGANARLTRTQGELQDALAREREARGVAEAAVLARDEFLSVAAHELRQPLAALRGFAQLMQRRLDRGGEIEPERVRELTNTIIQQADRTSRLVEQLMNVARIESGKLALDRKPVDLAELVRESVAAAQATTTRHRLVLDAPETLPAEVDPLRIGQVVSNLLSNAIKYSPNGGEVDVALRTGDRPPTTDDRSGDSDRSSVVSRPSSEGEAGSWVALSVRDRGVGIPSARQSQIFERFYQAHGEGHLGGLGLGLYIIRHIVELHGGTIGVESEEGRGSTFTVRLPV